MSAPGSTAADVLVIFGITGDLAKKMTFRSLYRLERRQMLHCPVIGVARSEWSVATLRDHARRAIEDTGEMIEEHVFRRFAERLSMIFGDDGDAKQPGAETTRTVDLSLIFAEELGEAPQPYERLLGDALKGDSSLFTREDSVEETWRIVQPLLDAPPQVEPYKPGSWGPAGADRLVAGHPSWRYPWLCPQPGSMNLAT